MSFQTPRYWYGYRAKFGYLASWAVAEGGLESLTAQLEIVQKESASLIERIDHAMTKYQKLSEDKVVSRDKVSMKENTFMIASHKQKAH